MPFNINKSEKEWQLGTKICHKYTRVNLIVTRTVTKSSWSILVNLYVSSIIRCIFGFLGKSLSLHRHLPSNIRGNNFYLSVSTKVWKRGSRRRKSTLVGERQRAKDTGLILYSHSSFVAYIKAYKIKKKRKSRVKKEKNRENRKVGRNLATSIFCLSTQLFFAKL